VGLHPSLRPSVTAGPRGSRHHKHPAVRYHDISTGLPPSGRPQPHRRDLYSSPVPQAWPAMHATYLITFAQWGYVCPTGLTPIRRTSSDPGRAPPATGFLPGSACRPADELEQVRCTQPSGYREGPRPISTTNSAATLEEVVVHYTEFFKNGCRPIWRRTQSFPPAIPSTDGVHVDRPPAA